MAQDMDESAAIVHALPTEDPGALGRNWSFEEFVQNEAVGLHGALRLLTHDRAEAEDLMQDALLRVWERWDRVRDLGRSRRLPLPHRVEPVPEASPADGGRGPIRHAVGLRPRRDELDEVESRDSVLRALAGITPRQRMGLVLTDLLDYSSEDAGRLMGVKPATVRVLASQGRAALRQSMGGDSGE